MPIYTNCPSCQSALSVGEHLQDKKIRCKKCSYVFTIEEALASSSEQDEAEIEGRNAQLQIQQTPQLPASPAAREGEPVSSPLIEQMPGDLPQIPSLRRERWRLIIGLAINGVVMFVLGGALVWYGGLSRKGASGQLTIDHGRTISVVAPKLDVPPPNADAVTKALFDLKSPPFINTVAAAWRLKQIAPNERREEVARALEKALLNENNRLNRREILDALAVWGTKDSVPALLNALEQGVPNEFFVAHDIFTLRTLFRALARFKDERVCEPIAHYLDVIGATDDAAKALKVMGPVAEKAVLKRIQHPDRSVRKAVCDVLRVIGTEESLPALKKEASGADIFTSDVARSAIQAIKARQK